MFSLPYGYIVFKTTIRIVIYLDDFRLGCALTISCDYVIIKCTC